VLPLPGEYDAVACANASGASAARQGLPDPTYTVMSAILSSGKDPSNRLALQALAGLRTGTVYLVPRPVRGATALGRRLRAVRQFRMSRPYFEWQIRRSGFHYDRLVAPSRRFFRDLYAELCGQDRDFVELLDRKMPSMGSAALALGLAEHKYRRFILSGFSFEITHAYADNPDIARRGTIASKHADTDIAFLRRVAQRFGNIWTSEPTVAARAGVPLLRPQADSPGRNHAVGAGERRYAEAVARDTI
jgi:hypothetical protein